MSLFAYRWLPRTILPNLYLFAYDIYIGIRNIIRWTPVIWYDRDYDWAYLAGIMEYKLRRMSKLFKEHGHHVNSDRDALETLICAELLHRLIEDDNRRQNDWYCKEFGRRLGKYMLHWWD